MRELGEYGLNVSQFLVRSDDHRWKGLYRIFGFVRY